MRPVSSLRNAAIGLGVFGSILHVSLLFQLWHGARHNPLTAMAFVLGPWLIVGACIALARNQTALGITVVFAVGYLAIGTALYCWNLYVQIDPQSGLAFVYVPSVALPLGAITLVMVWVTSFKPSRGRDQ